MQPAQKLRHAAAILLVVQRRDIALGLIEHYVQLFPCGGQRSAVHQYIVRLRVRAHTKGCRHAVDSDASDLYALFGGSAGHKSGGGDYLLKSLLHYASSNRRCR